MELLNPDYQSKERGEKLDEEPEDEPYKIQGVIAVVWETESGELTWYNGLYLGKNSDGTMCDPYS